MRSIWAVLIKDLMLRDTKLKSGDATTQIGGEAIISAETEKEHRLTWKEGFGCRSLIVCVRSALVRTPAMLAGWLRATGRPASRIYAASDTPRCHWLIGRCAVSVRGGRSITVGVAWPVGGATHFLRRAFYV